MDADFLSRKQALAIEILDLMQSEKNLQREITAKLLKYQSLERSQESMQHHHPLAQYAEPRPAGEVMIGS